MKIDKFTLFLGLMNFFCSIILCPFIFVLRFKGIFLPNWIIYFVFSEGVLGIILICFSISNEDKNVKRTIRE